MAINKVVYGNDILIDISGDTVTEPNLVSGVTAHNNAGEPIVGTHVCESPEVVERAATQMLVTADDTNDTLTVYASNTQRKGYVTDETEKSASTTITLTANGASVTAKASDGTNVSKSVKTAPRASTTLSATSIDSTGKITITASNTQSAGYVTDTAAKTASTVVTLTTSISNGTITAKAATDSSANSKSVTKTVTDTNLKQENIKDGVKIFGVTGNYTGSGSGGGTSNGVVVWDDTDLPSLACTTAAYLEIPLYYAQNNNFPDTLVTYYVLVDLVKKKISVSENNSYRFQTPSIDFSSYSYNGLANGYFNITYSGTAIMCSITNTSRCEVDAKIVGFGV